MDRATDVGVVLHQTSPNLRTLSVESDGNGSARGALGGSGTSIVNDRLVVLIRTMRKVHSNWQPLAWTNVCKINILTDVHARISELHKRLDVVGFGTNGSNDGSLRIQMLSLLPPSSPSFYTASPSSSYIAMTCIQTCMK